MPKNRKSIDTKILMIKYTKLNIENKNCNSKHRVLYPLNIEDYLKEEILLKLLNVTKKHPGSPIERRRGLTISPPRRQKYS